MRGMLRIATALAAAATTTAAATTPAHALERLDRYALQGRCLSLPGIAQADKVRLQATTLGEYLLFRPDRTFVAADGTAHAQPSPETEWVVREAGADAFTFTPKAGDTRERATTPVAATGCAEYPEAPLDAVGSPATGPEFGAVRGLLEGHMHWMTFEYFGRRFHCGRPWHKYGIAYALPDCSSVEGPQGANAPFQNFFNFGNPVQPHDTAGFPKLTEWSKDNLTYEGTYWRWIQRAWAGGLRLMVMGVNENRVLCELQANRETNCNEMDTVRRAIADMRELERYVDAQAGGPGQGFMRIVTDPFAARRAINAGKMAVVLEIEVSEPFDCRNVFNPTCDQAQVDRQLDEMHRLGVRSSLLLNKFDNPLTGVRFDDGAAGLIINAGNRQSAGTFFDARTCTGRLRDNTIETGSPQASAGVSALLGTLGVPGGVLPVYPPAPHCNTRGLTTLGKHVVERMMDLGMIVNPDHMSQAGVADTLSLLEARRYSGVISPHGWMDPGNWPRLWKLGGLAFPGHSAASKYVADWRARRPRQTPYLLGWGYGADLGGLSHQPTTPTGDGRLSYPFKSLDGRFTFNRQKTGDRTFDYAKEGVAHYGLYADWFADLKRLGGDRLADDMEQGAEAYLEMWERAEGVRAAGCRSPRRALGAGGLPALRLGATWTALLRAAGQPQTRTRTWTWCVAGHGNARAADAAVLGGNGRVALVGSDARGRSLGRWAVGSRIGGADGLRRDGTRLALVRGGRVAGVAVVTRAVAARPAALRQAVRRWRGARATQTARRFVANATASSRLSGQPIAATGDPRADAALTALCRLQLSALS